MNNFQIKYKKILQDADNFFKITTARKIAPIEKEEFKRRLDNYLSTLNCNSLLQAEEFDKGFEIYDFETNSLEIMFSYESRASHDYHQSQIIISNLNELKKQTMQFAAKNGWFCRFTSLDNIILSPNYGELVTSIPDKMYHVTLFSNLEKILSEGIKPTTGIRGDTVSFLPRVHLFTSYPEDKIFGVIWKTRRKEKKTLEGKDPRYTAILEIDTSKLRPKTKFYKDELPDMSNSVWTYSHIPPEAVSYVDSNFFEDYY
jgi:hypothetical protein